MRILVLGVGALGGTWHMQPALQLDHDPTVTPGTTATVPVNDNHPAQTPTTHKGGRTMRSSATGMSGDADTPADDRPLQTFTHQDRRRPVYDQPLFPLPEPGPQDCHRCIGAALTPDLSIDRAPTSALSIDAAPKLRIDQQTADVYDAALVSPDI